MLFACAAGIVAGTDSPAETKPGSDNYAVKVPVSDGSRDVTAAFLDALKGGFAPAESGISAAALTGGFIAAFVSGFLACNWMIGLVKRGKLI